MLRLAISTASLRLALEMLALAALLRRATSSANILSSQLSSIAASPANKGRAGQRPLLGLELGHLGTAPCSNQGVPWPSVLFWDKLERAGHRPLLEPRSQIRSPSWRCCLSRAGRKGRMLPEWRQEVTQFQWQGLVRTLAPRTATLAKPIQFRL